MLKIYFAGSIRGGRGDARIYAALIEFLEGYGEVLTEHIGNRSLKARRGEAMDSRDIHDRDLQWLISSDVVIAEVSMPSLGVGYEIARAVSLGKNVICLYRPQRGRKLSAMIAGSPDVQVYEYTTLEEAKRGIENALRQKAITSISISPQDH